ncbi:MAG: hypothetical protein KatS3mg044_0725 [Rhodothermaceae bacterium]|nr:MAG: response regulator [Bacteroidota bacterium]GIV61859.1 MAG: hypothetical protein KatS3mg044_0725 [Rhodothermaceae bacterium]
MSPSQRPRILIVEDNRDTQRLLDYQLNTLFDIDLVFGIDEALERVAQATYDLYILDINLGEKRTGIDLLNQLRARNLHQHVPALALTAYALPGDRERFLNEGFEAYVSKPFLRDDLIRTIRHVLSAHSVS